jgi:hypothetical protein
LTPTPPGDINRNDRMPVRVGSGFVNGHSPSESTLVHKNALCCRPRREGHPDRTDTARNRRGEE